MPCICPASALPAADGPAPFVGAFAYSAASFGGSGSVLTGGGAGGGIGRPPRLRRARLRADACAGVNGELCAGELG